MAFKITTRTASTSRKAEAEKDEFDGLWLNFGVVQEDEEGNEHFVRMPRGVAVSDLKEHKIYASTNEDWKAEATLVNQIINLIRSQAAKLEEGEAKMTKLSVQLYRRQETVEPITTVVEDAALAAELFE